MRAMVLVIRKTILQVVMAVIKLARTQVVIVVGFFSAGN